MDNYYLITTQQRLSEKDLLIYNAEVDRRKKSLFLCYFLLLFFPWAGIHRLYLDDNSGYCYPLLSLGGFFLFWYGAGRLGLLALLKGVEFSIHKPKAASCAIML